MVRILGSSFPILRRDSSDENYLEFINEDELSAMFSENKENENLDVSSLGILLVSISGMTPLMEIDRIQTDELYKIVTESGKVIFLHGSQGIAILDRQSRELEIVPVRRVSIGDTLVNFAGEFNNLFEEREYIDLINSFQSISDREKLNGVKVNNVREYLRSVISFDQSKLVNSMDFNSFSRIVAENGIFDDELENIRLYADDTNLQISSKLQLTEPLFQFLGLFWQYGFYQQDIPSLKLGSYREARSAARVIKKALNAGSTLIPQVDGTYVVSLHSSIYACILIDIFDLSADHLQSKLPARIFNAEPRYMAAFLLAICNQNVISLKGRFAYDQVIFLLNIVDIYPLSAIDGNFDIILSDEDLKCLDELSEQELDMPQERIQSAILEHLDETISWYMLKSEKPFFAGPGILVSGDVE